MSKIVAEVEIKQVRHGFEYSGHIHFGSEWQFNYTLTCDRSVAEIEPLLASDNSAAKKLIHIALNSSSNKPVTIPSELNPLFHGLLLPILGAIYYDPRTAKLNASEPEFQRQVELLGGDRGRVNALMTRHTTFEAEPLRSYLKSSFG